MTAMLALKRVHWSEWKCWDSYIFFVRRYDAWMQCHGGQQSYWSQCNFLTICLCFKIFSENIDLAKSDSGQRFGIRKRVTVIQCSVWLPQPILFLQWCSWSALVWISSMVEPELTTHTLLTPIFKYIPCLCLYQECLWLSAVIWCPLMSWKGEQQSHWTWCTILHSCFWFVSSLVLWNLIMARTWVGLISAAVTKWPVQWPLLWSWWILWKIYSHWALCLSRVS